MKFHNVVSEAAASLLASLCLASLLPATLVHSHPQLSGSHRDLSTSWKDSPLPHALTGSPPSSDIPPKLPGHPHCPGWSKEDSCITTALYMNCLEPHVHWGIFSSLPCHGHWLGLSRHPVHNALNMTVKHLVFFF